MENCLATREREKQLGKMRRIQRFLSKMSLQLTRKPLGNMVNRQVLGSCSWSNYIGVVRIFLLRRSQWENIILKEHTITAKKHDTWLKSSYHLARCHAFCQYSITREVMWRCVSIAISYTVVSSLIYPWVYLDLKDI